jgi:hypothetical protein
MSILSQFKQSQNTDFPNVRPSLDLRFALAKKLDPRITFTRGSTGTYFGSDGIMRTAGVNEPRFDHDPITGQSLGLLIEESRSNLVTYSDDFSNASWARNNYNINTNVITAPDGTLTADKLIPINASTAIHDLYKTPNLSSNTYTLSIFAKAAEQNLIRLRIDDGIIARNTIFNLTTGSVSSNTNVTSSSIIPYPNGWYRCSITVTTNIINLVFNTPSVFLADGTTGIYIWGAQLEAGAFPTSYIPTTASTVTRSADNASMTGTNFSSWYNQSEGTIVISTDKLYSGNFDTYRHYYQIGDVTATNVFGSIYTIPAAQFITNYGTTNAGRQVFDYQQIFVGSSPTQFKIGQALNLKYSFFTSSKGTTPPQLPSKSAPNSQNNTTPTNVDRMTIGSKLNGGLINSHIARLTYYPIQLTNQQLINLTS